MSNIAVNEGLLMTARDRGPDRMYVEQEKLRTYFPQFALYGSHGRIEGARGWLETNAGRRYWLRIVLSSDYPHSMPAVFPEGWKPDGVHHVYSNGSLCLMKPSQWRSHWTLAYVVAKCALWVNKYDVWQSTGRWPGREQSHGDSPSLPGFLRELFT